MIKDNFLQRKGYALGTVHYSDTFAYLSNGKVWQKTSYETHSGEKDKKRNETITYYTYDTNGDLVEDQYIGMDDFKVGTSYCYENKKLKENYTYVQEALKSVTFWKEEMEKRPSKRNSLPMESYKEVFIILMMKRELYDGTFQILQHKKENHRNYR